MKRTARYWKKRQENKLSPLSELPEDERIYLNVKYKARSFAKYCRCGFDTEKKLWFAGVNHDALNLYALVELYGINKITSDKARERLNNRLEGIKTPLTDL